MYWNFWCKTKRCIIIGEHVELRYACTIEINNWMRKTKIRKIKKTTDQTACDKFTQNRTKKNLKKTHAKLHLFASCDFHMCARCFQWWCFLPSSFDTYLKFEWSACTVNIFMRCVSLARIPLTNTASTLIALSLSFHTLTECDSVCFSDDSHPFHCP